MPKAKAPSYSDTELAAVQLELRRRQREKAQRLIGYRTDPLGYLRQQFPDVTFSPDIEKTIQAVAKYPVVGIESGNSTGKTHCAAFIIKWFYDCFGAEEDEDEQSSCEIYVGASPPARNLNRIYSELSVLYRKYPKVFAGDELKAERLISGPKHFVEFVPIPANQKPEQQKEAFAGKHARYMLFLLDEANGVPESIYGAIRECMTSGLVVRLVFFYNPRGREGPAYERVHAGRCYSLRIPQLTHPNVLEGYPVIPGAVTRDSVVKMIATMTHPLRPTQEWDDDLCFDIPPQLVGASAIDDNGQELEPLTDDPREIHNQDFCSIVLGRPPKTSANRLIPDEWIDEARSKWDYYVAQNGERPPLLIDAIMGLDVAEEHDLNALVLRYGTFVPMPETWTGVNIPETERRAYERFQTVTCTEIFVDGTGLGAGVAPHLVEKGVPATSVKIASSPTLTYIETATGERTEIEFRSLRDQLLWQLREWLDPKRGAMLPPLQRMIEPMRKMTYRKHHISLKIEVMDKPVIKSLLGYSPDEMEALALTFARSGGGWGMWVARR